MQFIEIEWQSDLYRDEIELRDQLLRAPLGLIFTDEDLQAESNQLHFGILQQQVLIACAVIVPIPDSTAKLRQMAVATSHQRRQVGTNLVQNIESALADRRYQTIELHAREHAVGFYEKLGYRKQGAVHRGDCPALEDDEVDRAANLTPTSRPEGRIGFPRVRSRRQFIHESRPMTSLSSGGGSKSSSLVAQPIPD